MAVYPPRGLDPWDAELKAYIDAVTTAEGDEAKAAATAALVAHVAAANPHTQYLFRYAEILPTGTDLNIVTEPGIYAITGAVNRPVAATAVVRVVGYGTLARVQEFFEMTGSYRGRLWLRSTIDAGAEWSEWKPTDILTHEAASDPHAQYARKAVTNNWTALQQIDTAGGALRIRRSNGTEDQRAWLMQVGNVTGALMVEPIGDNNASNGTPFILHRNGSIQRGGILEITGTGNPNGVHAAPVGSTFRNTEIGGWNGARVWRKDAGTGSTGWVVESGDTGLRDVSVSLADGWTGTVLVHRRDATVHMAANGLTGASASVILPLPSGFRGLSIRGDQLVPSGSGVASTTVARLFPASTGSVWGSPMNGAQFGVGWETGDPWPSTLPGTPA